jgi:hypothetical protein
MSNEDQLLELEALESLFPDEFKKVSDCEFTLTAIVPFPDQSTTNHVSVSVSCMFPTDYPVSAPLQVSLTKVTGCLTSDSHLVGQLESIMEGECEANLGMPAVYSLVERIQDFLRENNQPELSLHDQMERGNQREMVETESGESDDEEDGEGEDDEEFQGLMSKILCPENERVTSEEFQKWKLNFDLFLISQKIIKRNDENKLSGKQQFLQRLHETGENDDDDEAVPEIDEGLYDDDLDDLDFDDEE